MSKEAGKLTTVSSATPPPDELASLLGIDECLRWYPPNLETIPDPETIFRTAEPPRAGREIDLFVDVPYCNTICGFCPFNVYPYAKADVAAYLGALEKEIRLVKSLHDFTGTRVRTVWVGGGTPSMLEDDALDRLLQVLHEGFDLGRLDEFTVEIKPMRATLTDSKLEILRRNRVDRISMGVQSSQPHFLDLLGRGYRIDEPLEVIRTIKAAGFEVNIDMMYRLPGQGRVEVAEDLDAVRWLGIDHLSWFPYVPHGNTPLARKIELGKVAPHADRREYLEMYKLVADRMGDAGYQHYTPYYFAARRQCAHHVGRWRLPQVETLGLGAGAFSYFNGWIYADEHSPAKYREAVEAGKPPIMRGKKLSDTERITRLAVLGIKFFTIDLEEFRQASGVRMEEFYARELDLLERLGLVELRDGQVSCTTLGRAFNNDVATVFGTDTSRRTRHPQGVDLMRVRS